MWQVADRHAGDSVAVVSHGGPIALFCQTILGLPYRRPMPFAVDNCSLTIVQVHDGEPAPGRARATLLTLNDRCHLKNLEG
jgi:alpha-ribazole phosphatase/probable phosphoglycerate mutase